MKTLLVTLSAASAVALAAPAVAQTGYYGYQNNYPSSSHQSRGYANADFTGRISELQARLDAGIRAGTISRSEAMNLRREIRDLWRLDRQYQAGGYSWQERRDLQQRIQAARQEIRVADNGYYDRYERYGSNDNGYGNGYGTSRYDNGYGTNRYGNGYDDNGYYGQGGPDEEVDVADCDRGGVSGFFDRLIGNHCLRIGERVTSNLYAVPPALRDEYRDGYGYYYRSDGRAIYQIDSRTNTVMRVYPLER